MLKKYLEKIAVFQPIYAGWIDNFTIYVETSDGNGLKIKDKSKKIKVLIKKVFSVSSVFSVVKNDCAEMVSIVSEMQGGKF